MLFFLSPTKLFSQLNLANDFYIFSRGEPIDNSEELTSYVNQLKETHLFFERSYLSGDIVYVPVPDSILLNETYNIFEVEQSKIILADSITTNYSEPTKKFLKSFDKEFYHIIDSLNAFAKVANKVFELSYTDSIMQKSFTEDRHILKIIEEILTPEENELIDGQMHRYNTYSVAQLAIVKEKIRYRKDFNVFLVNKNDITTYSDHFVLSNEVDNDLDNAIQQQFLGIPKSVKGYVKSINYVNRDWKQLDSLPELIDNLLKFSLFTAKNQITKRKHRKKIANVGLDFTYIKSDNDNFWVYSNLNSKTIYISPLLLRAVFNLSYYNQDLSELLYRIPKLETEEILVSYFDAKVSNGDEFELIRENYSDVFINSFVSNFLFVLGHELAHFYVENSKDLKSLELTCDCYAAKGFVNYFGFLELGVFESMLITSIEEDSAFFWGNLFKQTKEELINRSKILNGQIDGKLSFNHSVCSEIVGKLKLD